MTNLAKLEKAIGVKFKNKNLLKEALTHSSYVNENPGWTLSHNERLEYLGDAVLGLAVGEFLFKKYPAAAEEQLTSFRAALVNYRMLAQVARELDLEDYLFLSRGEAKNKGRAREVILADALEAVIGAIYLDRNYKSVQKFIAKHLLEHLEEVMANKLYQDPKSRLQELVQEKSKTTPLYRVLGEEGPEHQKKFSVGVFVDGQLLAKGKGSSKSEAERQAAQTALLKINE